MLKLVDKVPNHVPSQQTVDNIVRGKSVVVNKPLAAVLPEVENTTVYMDETHKFGETYEVYVATDSEVMLHAWTS